MRRASMIRAWARPASLAFSLIALATYCSDNGTAPKDNTVVAVTLDPLTATLRVGATTQLTATGTNAAGVAINNGVQFSSSDASIANVTSFGVVRGLKPGVATITAQGGNAQKSAVITVIPGLPSSITKVAGDAQFAEVQRAVAIAPAVQVRDSAGNTIAGATVTFEVQSGGGSITGASAVTNASGVATVGSWTLGAQTGGNALVATVLPATAPISATFLATATPRTAGPPATIVINGGNQQSAVIGTAVAVAPSVVVRDAAGLPVPNAPVTFAVTSGGGTLVGASTFTNAAGIATLGSWTLGSNLGDQTITATVGSLAPVTITATAKPVPQPPTHLGIARPPSGAIAGSPFTVQPWVEVRDLAGNLVPTATNVVTATISLGGRLTGTVSVAAVEGVAKFTDLTPLDLGTYTLDFVSPGLIPASTTVLVGTGAAIAIVAPTQFTAVAAGADPAAQTVAVTSIGSTATVNGLSVAPIDYLGSSATGWLTASVSSAITPSTLVLQPKTAGLAPGTYSARVTVNGTGSTPATVDVTFVVTPQTPARLAILTQPVGGSASGTLATQPVIEVQDANGVRVAGSTILVGVAVASGPGGLTGATQVTALNGIVTYSSLRLATPGTYTLIFAAPGVQAVTSAPFTVVP